MIPNLSKIFRQPICPFIFLGSFFAIASIFWQFSDFALTKGNLGEMYAVTEVVLEVGISFLFALFIAATTYKIRYFSQFSKKHSGAGLVGGFLGTLVVGCPACSISVATYLGLTGFVSLIPGVGLWIKGLSVVLLIVTDWHLLRNLEVCTIKRKKR